MTDFRALLADDAFAASFQSLGQYRTALLATLFQPESQEPTDEELESIARTAELFSMKKQGGLTSLTPEGIHAQLQEQRLAGLRAVAARRPSPKPPSLKEQALALLQPGEPRLFNSEMQDTLRRALEQLDD
jgi:hypothetical protein